jgi:hypothetical protein
MGMVHVERRTVRAINVIMPNWMLLKQDRYHKSNFELLVAVANITTLHLNLLYHPTHEYSVYLCPLCNSRLDDILSGNARLVTHAPKQTLLILKQFQRRVKLLNLARGHDEDSVPRDDGTQSVSNAQKRLALELVMDRLLDLGIRLKVCTRVSTDTERYFGDDPSVTHQQQQLPRPERQSASP